MEDQLSIPIPHFPPFQLRSSLIDKDPVIWVHLIEGYIELCQVLLKGEVKLHVKSQQQLQLFLKVYLSETSQESKRIFSLGAINPDIRANTEVLRAYILQVIRDYGLVKLGIQGESLWHFVNVYVEKNATVVRGLLAGTLKSKFNDNKKSGKISLIPPLRRYLQEKVKDGEISPEIPQYLAMLLGQHSTLPKTQTLLMTGGGANNHRVVKKERSSQNSSSALQFAEMFVSIEWIESLETTYAGGQSVHATAIRNLMLISVLSLSTAKLASLVATLGIHSSGTLMVAPLLCAIIISDEFKRISPDIEERLPFLRDLEYLKASSVSESDIVLLQDMFPDITSQQALAILLKNDNNIDLVINLLLEDPSLINEMITSSQSNDTPKNTGPSSQELELGIKRFSLKENETTEILKKLTSANNKEENKKKTLTHALRLLYESDEDERDDTYDDITEFTESRGKPDHLVNSKNQPISEEDMLEDFGEPIPPAPTEHDVNSLILFEYLKEKGELIFERTCRKKAERASMRKATNWSDEQIEGWYRMLLQSPKRYKVLEEKFQEALKDRALTQRVKKQIKLEDEPELKPSVPKTKKSLARKEQNKASVANHSRKKGHDKKSKAALAGMQ
ncbi:hypothetical protein PUMCH_002132 [Australozyma saopauloensis]|uniref:CUE domain-containing protein n=1 Tax=Australozyma saopauloensis TaxID=291208 RepID=A0AAX4HAS5_9ASCO|nr:hypothetical protein PUMCH_002132 [[Candida] saopauloensis]